MRKAFCIVAFLGMALGASAQLRAYSQLDLLPSKPCDRVKYRINYDMAFVTDTTKHPYEPQTEPMVLEVGEHSTKFYSYDKQRADSINREKMNRGEQNLVSGEKITWVLHRDYPRKGQYALLDGLGLDRYVCMVKADEPKWSLVPDSTAEIMGYPCRLAVAEYKGRAWSAWYTDDVPLSYGPWKLMGLPGLVLRAYDAERHYVFEASGLRQYGDGEGYEMDYRGDDYEELDAKTLARQYERYHADPVGYVSNNPNVKVTILDEHGNPTTMPALPYNPIER